MISSYQPWHHQVLHFRRHRRCRCLVHNPILQHRLQRQISLYQDHLAEAGLIIVGNLATITVTIELAGGYYSEILQKSRIATAIVTTASFTMHLAGFVAKAAELARPYRS